MAHLPPAIFARMPRTKRTNSELAQHAALLENGIPKLAQAALEYPEKARHGVAFRNHVRRTIGAFHKAARAFDRAHMYGYAVSLDVRAAEVARRWARPIGQH